MSTALSIPANSKGIGQAYLEHDDTEKFVEILNPNDGQIAVM